MKTKVNFHNIKPHLFAVILFAIVSFGYFNPVLEGKMLRQGDMMAYAGAVQELKELKAQTGEYALWTDRMFGGMPTFLINNPGHANLTRYVHNILNLNHPRPANHIFLYMLGFYLALLMFGITPWISIAGAFAYAFSTYFIIIIDAGHITKVMALGYMPLVIASTYYALKTDRIVGSILLGLSLSMQIYVNHLQITYYTFIIIVLLGIIELWSSIKTKQLSNFGKSVGYLIIGATLAIASNLTTLWTVYEYGKYSMRGKPNLIDNTKQQTTGLDPDYITSWSYGKVETLNLLIPNMKGGSSYSSLDNNSATYKALESNYGKPTADKYSKQIDTYWGDQPFTSGPVYIGATVILLSLLSIFILKGNIKWWLLLATILAIILAWGKHFMWFNNLIIHYLPGYNKFRTVSMTLVIAQFTLPLLGLLIFDQISKKQFTYAQIKRPLYYSTGILTAILLLILAIYTGGVDMTGQTDINLPETIREAVKADRLSMLQADIFRSLLFVIATSGLIWFIANNKIKKRLGTIALMLLFITDLIPVTHRYSHNNNWESRSQLQQNPFTPTHANQTILKDKNHYRVLNLTSNTFNDATTSYFHNSIGGYHGAKMQRYQELISHQIQPEMKEIISLLQDKPTPEQVDTLLQNLDILNMLNTKYYIISPDHNPIVNQYAYGAAWFVDSTVQADGANNEMQLLTSTNLKHTAVVDKQYIHTLGNNVSNNPNNSISLKSYSANRIEYNYRAETNALAVFSEIYYPQGWEATIDNKPVEIIRANYLLRAALLPAGSGTIVFEFRPKSYYVGNTISYTGSAILLILGAITLLIRMFKKTQAAQDKKPSANKNN